MVACSLNRSTLAIIVEHCLCCGVMTMVAAYASMGSIQLHLNGSPLTESCSTPSLLLAILRVETTYHRPETRSNTNCIFTLEMLSFTVSLDAVVLPMLITCKCNNVAISDFPCHNISPFVFYARMAVSTLTNQLLDVSAIVASHNEVVPGGNVRVPQIKHSIGEH
ncbi:uncharacterized protein F5891DRAFT_739536 [Suillus fuscotomentosus]|uniref:Uncharacterized protein n=1 Tax=Suillus fuscotomentosus TaxID=1912939 RepID=A0AAD4DU31_9AGAM|nr:uncharacterized protein F5891DRAFT_739536 [Suillus fuscotomentosus]KAG1893946.1 hypothetical protein F5891DRAFT_739536 [Suillus fuscotomentosus]